jgi:hypothetical protein
MLVEDRDGALIIFHMEGQGGSPAGTCQERVGAKNVYICREQCGEKAAEFGWAFWKFNNHEIAY